MKKDVFVGLGIGVFITLLVAAFAAPSLANSAESYVLEGGINRVEGFVPFDPGSPIQTKTQWEYDVVSTVYRVDPDLAVVTIEIAGGQESWQPWISSGEGTPAFEGGVWVFPMVFPTSGKVEVGLRAPAPIDVDHIVVEARDCAGVVENRQAAVQNGRHEVFLPVMFK